MSNKKEIIKVIVVGESATGKTKLAERICNDIYEKRSEITLGVDFFVKTIEKESVEYEIQMWDTCGSENFRGIINSYFRNSHICLLCFDATRESTLNELEYWKNRAKEKSGIIEPVYILLGNKSDKKESKKISDRKIKEFKDKHSIEHYFDVSSKTNINVDQISNLTIKLFNEKFRKKDNNNKETIVLNTQQKSPTVRLSQSQNPRQQNRQKSTSGGCYC